jgi:hypothetical protein
MLLANLFYSGVLFGGYELLALRAVPRRNRELSPARAEA